MSVRFAAQNEGRSISTRALNEHPAFFGIHTSDSSANNSRIAGVLRRNASVLFYRISTRFSNGAWSEMYEVSVCLTCSLYMTLSYANFLCRGLVSAMVKLLKDSMMYCVGESPYWEGNVHRDVVLLERWRSSMDKDARAISLIKFGGFGAFSGSEASEPHFTRT